MILIPSQAAFWDQSAIYRIRVNIHSQFASRDSKPQLEFMEHVLFSLYFFIISSHGILALSFTLCYTAESKLFPLSIHRNYELSKSLYKLTGFIYKTRGKLRNTKTGQWAFIGCTITIMLMKWNKIRKANKL